MLLILERRVKIRIVRRIKDEKMFLVEFDEEIESLVADVF